MSMKLGPEGWTQGMYMLALAMRGSIAAVREAEPCVRARLECLRSRVEDVIWELECWREILPIQDEETVRKEWER